MSRRKATPEQQAQRKADKAAARADKYAAQLAAAHAFEELHGLPPLTRSDLQTIWAACLRFERASADPELLALLGTAPPEVATAAFWIKTRFASMQGLRETISQAGA